MVSVQRKVGRRGQRSRGCSHNSHVGAQLCHLVVLHISCRGPLSIQTVCHGGVILQLLCLLPCAVLSSYHRSMR